jgi:hypothetical protein
MTTETMTLAEDPAVRQARELVADLERQLADAQAASRRPMGLIAAPENRRAREARERAHEFEDALGPARRAREQAEQAARRRLLAAEQPVVVAEARRLIALLEPLRVAVEEIVAARTARAVRAGLTMPALFPVPELLGVASMIARLRREMDDPPPVAAAPRPPHTVRVRALQRFRDGAGMWHEPQYAGQPSGPLDLPDGEAATAIKAGWAAPWA